MCPICRGRPMTAVKGILNALNCQCDAVTREHWILAIVINEGAPCPPPTVALRVNW